VVNRQIRLIALPKSIGLPVREVWSMQPRFEMTQGGRPFRLLGHPRFRAAYDFLLLRAETGEADPALAEWWTRFQSANEAEQKSMVRSGQRSSTRTRTRKRRPRKKAPGHAPIS
jgi:poly(A) polymerase